MEGVVAKRAGAKYTPEATTWVEFKNRQHSQAVRRDVFLAVRRRRKKVAPSMSFFRVSTPGSRRVIKRRKVEIAGFSVIIANPEKLSPLPHLPDAP